jgi:putative membrane protein
MMDGGFGGMGLIGGLGILSMIVYIAIIIGVVMLIVWVVQRVAGGGNRNSFFGSSSPREILQARYARGEITREQYQQMLQDLS